MALVDHFLIALWDIKDTELIVKLINHMGKVMQKKSGENKRKGVGREA